MRVVFQPGILRIVISCTCKDGPIGGSRPGRAGARLRRLRRWRSRAGWCTVMQCTGTRPAPRFRRHPAAVSPPARPEKGKGHGNVCHLHRFFSIVASQIHRCSRIAAAAGRLEGEVAAISSLGHRSAAPHPAQLGPLHRLLAPASVVLDSSTKTCVLLASRSRPGTCTTAFWPCSPVITSLFFLCKPGFPVNRIQSIHGEKGGCAPYCSLGMLSDSLDLRAAPKPTIVRRWRVRGANGTSKSVPARRTARHEGSSRPWRRRPTRRLRLDAALEPCRLGPDGGVRDGSSKEALIPVPVAVLARVIDMTRQRIR